MPRFEIRPVTGRGLISRKLDSDARSVASANDAIAADGVCVSATICSLVGEARIMAVIRGTIGDDSLAGAPDSANGL